MSKRKKNADIQIEELPTSRPIKAEIEEHLKQIREMREEIIAPVDTMGCHMLADKEADPKTYRFQILMALMLSSQTKDQVTAAAMERLRRHGCTVDEILSINDSDLENLLIPVGFYKRKTQYLKRAAAILKEKYGGDIPDTFNDLCSLPGVGPKMANLALQIAFNKVEGIAVDTHVHRIANRLGWVNTNSPEQTEEKLKELLPRSEWSSINKLLVGFGQTVCLPMNPKCDTCTNYKFCPWRSLAR